jgi:hypothetical protein
MDFSLPAKNHYPEGFEVFHPSTPPTIMRHHGLNATIRLNVN